MDGKARSGSFHVLITHPQSNYRSNGHGTVRRIHRVRETAQPEGVDASVDGLINLRRLLGERFAVHALLPLSN